MEDLRNRFASSVILWAIVLGVISALVVYRLQVNGVIKTDNTVVQNQQTTTVVKEENAVVDTVEKSSPSVVAISTTQRVSNPFDPFSIPQNLSSTIGTGFVVSQKGIIVTNKHVVADDGKYSVVTKEGKKYDVKKIYRDPVLDLAIVSIDANLSALDLGDSSKLKVGQTVIAIGNALGKFTNTVTTGVVSGLGRRVVAGDPYSGSSESLDNLIQTDAAINPGNSGGPLLNSMGQVIGVNVATTEGAQNIGFAIPINSVKRIVNEFVDKGVVSHPFLGIKYLFVPKDRAILNNIPEGAYVQDVVGGSAADKAGIRDGDVITKIEGQAIDSENKISDIIAVKKIGDLLNLTIWNDGEERKISATLQDLPNQ